MIEILWDREGYEDLVDEPMQEHLHKLMNFVLGKEGLQGQYQLSFTVTDKESIQEINREYRSVDRVTDVLSFPMYEREELEEIERKKDYDKYEISIGDILICYDKVKEQAEEFGHSLERELCYLTVHSMFHLLGYDHMEEEEKRLMREKEEEVMQEFGIIR